MCTTPRMALTLEESEYARHCLLPRALPLFECTMSEPIKQRLRDHAWTDQHADPTCNHPTWLHQAMRPFGRIITNWIKEHPGWENSVWDTYTLGRVIPGCIVAMGLDDAAAATVQEMLQATFFRTEAAHASSLPVGEVVKALRALDQVGHHAHKKDTNCPHHCCMSLCPDHRSQSRHPKYQVLRAFGYGAVADSSEWRASIEEARALAPGPCWVSPGEARELALHLALADFERRAGGVVSECTPPGAEERLEASYICGHMRKCTNETNGKKACGKGANSKHYDQIKALRNWLHHSAGQRRAAPESAVPPPIDAVASMRSLLEKVPAMKSAFDAGSWGRWEGLLNAAAAAEAAGDNVALEVVADSAPATQGRVPFERERCLIERSSQPGKTIVAALLPEGARVHIGGSPGVGKDVLAVEALADSSVTATIRLPFMPFWLPGTTDDTLRAKLQQLGIDHVKEVSDKDEQEEALLKVKAWLEATDGWMLYVEDLADPAAAVLAEMLPHGRGRVLITSSLTLDSADLGLTAPSIVLEEFSTDESIDLIRKMGISKSTLR